MALYHEWGDVDRSHRKLAHRGSYLGRCGSRRPRSATRPGCSGPASPPAAASGGSIGKPFPEWVEYRPNQLWIYDTTHFTAAKSCLTVVEDLVSRKWIADILSSEETSTQVQIVFTDALVAEGLSALRRGEGRRTWRSRRRRRTPADPARGSDNGPQMTSGRPASSWRCAPSPSTSGVPARRPTRRGSRASTATSRPSTPTSSDHRPRRAAGRARRDPPPLERVRLHAGIGTSRQTTSTRAGPRHPQGAGSGSRRHAPPHHVPSKARPAATRPGTPRCRLIKRGSLSQVRNTSGVPQEAARPQLPVLRTRTGDVVLPTPAP